LAASPFHFPRDKARFVMRLGILLYALASAIYLAVGQVNADEGWYLYASQLVFRGALPYRDFAFTQMPLLPYVYGVLQILHPSLFLGRLTSALLSLGTFFMGIVIARRYGGPRAGMFAALLLACFTFGVYYNTIVKTYALVTFCFTATLHMLSSDLGKRMYPLAVLYALVAALVRVTAVFFAVPILVYCLIAAPRKPRWLILGASVAMSIAAGFFIIPAWPAARWGLFTSHLSHWGTAPLFDQVRDILTGRLPAIVQTFGPLLVLGGAAGYFLLRDRDTKTWPRDPAPLLVVSAGLVLFAASHLANGLWDVEYLVPAATVFLPILAIVVSRLYAESVSASRSFIQATLIAIVFLLPLGESTQHTDLTGGRLPLAEIDQVASFVIQNSQPNDKVLALEALGVTVDANRLALPGTTLAQFSLQPLDGLTAKRLHVFNNDLLAEAIEQKAARVIILTDGDLDRVAGSSPPHMGAIRRALNENYRLGLVLSDFGQYSDTVHVYLSR
jgi:hypothetical protein